MILVTGGAGYIGSHFVRYYLSKYPTKKLVVVDNLIEGHVEALDGLDRVVNFSADIGDVSSMRNIFDQIPISAVVHFAAHCYVGEAQQKPSKYFQNNVINALNLLKVMNEHKVKKFVFSSTCATYGNPRSVPIDESHIQEPINVYGMTKLMVEQALRSYSDTSGWSYVALRYFNAAGADDSALIGESHNPETHIIPLTLQAALGKRECIEVFGDDYDTPDGTCIRDYVHVNDLAAAHLQALELVESKQIGEAVNLGTTYGASVKEIISVCQQVTGRTISVKNSPRRFGDPPRLIANNNKAKELLGWKPQYDLNRTIATAWNWEQNRRF